jgi:hypothetical protein
MLEDEKTYLEFLVLTKTKNNDQMSYRILPGKHE